jgi:hypothetical protein
VIGNLRQTLGIIKAQVVESTGQILMHLRHPRIGFLILGDTAPAFGPSSLQI